VKQDGLPFFKGWPNRKHGELRGKNRQDGHHCKKENTPGLGVSHKKQLTLNWKTVRQLNPRPKSWRVKVGRQPPVK